MSALTLKDPATGVERFAVPADFGSGGPTQGAATTRGVSTSDPANTSIEAVPANAARKFLRLKNRGTAEAYVDFGRAATVGHPSWRIAGGEELVFDGSGFVPTNSVTLISGTVSVPFSIVEGT